MFKKFNKEFYIKIGIALTVIVVTAAVIWGAWRVVEDKTIVLENASEVYQQAVEQLSARDNIYYKVTGTQKKQTASGTVVESFVQLITYESQNTNFRGCVEEDLTIGDHEITSFEFFADNVAYFTTQGASFQAEMTKQEYTARYTPAAPIDSALYAEISGTRNRKETNITFKKPGAIALWINEAGAQLIDGTASVVLDGDGNLTFSKYAITYTTQAVTINLDIAVEIIYNDLPPIQLPSSDAYTPISNIDVPKILEKSCGYLTSLQTINSVYSEVVYCEAFGDKREQTIQLSLNKAESFSASVDTNSAISNSSKTDAISSSVRKDLFENGAFLYSADGINFQEDASIDQGTMTSYCENLLIGTVPLPEHIHAAEITTSNNTVQIQFQPGEDFAYILAQDACLTLYQNATILIEQALSYKTDEITCYLDISADTGFPIASGFYYSGTYDIGGIPYKLTFKADQIYSTSAIEQETPETEPTEESNV